MIEEPLGTDGSYVRDLPTGAQGWPGTTRAAGWICFATMAKNEEHCIRATLEAAAPHADSFLLYDTGSTDRTIEIAEAFFAERGKSGCVVRAPWEGFAISKTKMMAAAREMGCNWILHLDADDRIENFDRSSVDPSADLHFATLRRGGTTFKATILYRGDLTWRFCGVAHTIIRCVERAIPKHGTIACNVDAEERGSRALDPDKYLRDAERLVAQFNECTISDPDGLLARSAFYAAQSYFDARRFVDAAAWYAVYLRMATWDEERFEAHLRRARCMRALDCPLDEIRAEIDQAIAIAGDRAEPYLCFGTWFNQASRHAEAYVALKLAQRCDLDAVLARYVLFVDRRAYGKHVNDELSVACYWTDRWDEGIQLATEIVDDPAFVAARPRIVENLGHLSRRKHVNEEENLRDVHASTEQVHAVDQLLRSVKAAPRDLYVEVEALGTFALGARLRQVIVADDFYAAPDAVRQHALSSAFVASPSYHKGQRTLTAHRPDHVRSALEELLGKRITKWDYGTNGVFQFCTAEDPVVYHCDEQQYAAVVYLTPDAPPEAGSSFYRHRGTKRRAAPQPRDQVLMKALFAGGFYDRTQFEAVDVVGNVYNRLVVWNARLIHAASGYFGQGLEDARLFQMFFFDAS